MLPLSKWENQDKSHSRGRELLGDLHQLANDAADDGSDHSLQRPGCRGDLLQHYLCGHYGDQHRLGGCPGRLAQHEHRDRDVPLLHARDRSGCRRL